MPFIQNGVVIPIEAGDVILELNQGTILGNLITIAGSFRRESHQRKNTVHAGIMSGTDTLTDVTGRGISSSRIEMTRDGGLRLIDHDQLISPGLWRIYRYSPIDQEDKYPACVVKEVSMRFLPSITKITDSEVNLLEKFVEKRIRDKENISDRNEAAKQELDAFRQVDALLKKEHSQDLLKLSLAYAVRETAASLAAGLAGQSDEYQSGLTRGKYATMLAFITGLSWSEKITESQKNFMQQQLNGNFQLGDTFYCSNFVVYIYALASLIQNHSMDSAIDLNAWRVLPATLHHYFDNSPNWKNLTENVLRAASSLTDNSVTSGGIYRFGFASTSFDDVQEATVETSDVSPLEDYCVIS